MKKQKKIVFLWLFYRFFLICQSFQKWPEDALKRSADFLFEEINAERNTKKIICKIGMDVYQKAL